MRLLLGLSFRWHKMKVIFLQIQAVSQWSDRHVIASFLSDKNCIAGGDIASNRLCTLTLCVIAPHLSRLSCLVWAQLSLFSSWNDHPYASAILAGRMFAELLVFSHQANVNTNNILMTPWTLMVYLGCYCGHRGAVHMVGGVMALSN